MVTFVYSSKQVLQAFQSKLSDEVRIQFQDRQPITNKFNSVFALSLSEQLVSAGPKMYDTEVINEAPYLNGYNYSDYFEFMECYIEYQAGLEHIQSPKLEDSNLAWALLQDHLKFVLKQTVNREHRNLFKPDDSVYMMWTKLKLQEANFNRLIAHQELTHQILYLRHSILKKIGYAREQLNRKRKPEENDEDAVRLIKVIKKEEC